MKEGEVEIRSSPVRITLEGALDRKRRFRTLISKKYSMERAQDEQGARQRKTSREGGTDQRKTKC